MMDDAELVRQLREPTFERGLDEKWIDAQRNCAADRIEALIAARAAARDAAMEEAAEAASARKGNGWEGAPAVHPYDKGYIAACDAVAAAIRALKGKSHE